MWWLLGLLAVAIAAAAMFLTRRRRRPPESLRSAYVATAALRDRLAQEVSTPSAAPGVLEQLLDEADRSLRAVQVIELDTVTRSTVDRALSAVAEIREALALRGATADAAHARGADVESALLRSLASLDAALGPLRAAASGEPPPDPTESTGGFIG